MKFLLSLTLIFSCFISTAQNDARYFKDQYLTKPTTADKARYVASTTRQADGTYLTSLTDLKRNEIIKMENNLGEPFGKQTIQTGRGKEIIDYDFKLNYKDTLCSDGSFALHVNTPMQDHDSLSYKAPRLSGSYNTFVDLLVKKIRYPEYARENNISGRVLVRFTVTKTGSVENLSIVKSVHPSIDKEAVRVVRLATFGSPATIEGKPADVCVTLPIRFALE